MIQTTLTIDGMACTMCEAHVNDAIRRVCQVKKVSSSYKKGTTEILSEAPLETSLLHQALDGSGYRILRIESRPVEKKRFSLFGR